MLPFITPALIGWLKDRLPQIIIGIVAAVLIAAVGLWIAKQEREEQRQENVLVETGRKEVTVQHQQEVLNNVKVAKEAVERPTLDQSERVRSKYERCRGDDC